jgi:ribosomal protein S18 acetylase RimI-like enzyme
MDVVQLRESVDRYGLNATAYDLAYRAASKFADLMILKAIVITMATLDRKYLEDGNGKGGSEASSSRVWGFLDRETLVRAASAEAAEDMDVAFIDAALSRGDRCYGLVEEGKVVSYGWYSTRPTEVTDDLELRFDPSYAYMYKGFTLPSHRGQRLHGIGMARALRALTEEGLKGLVSYVRSNNFASLKSCYRMGYKDFGQIVIVRFRGRVRSYATRGCSRYDFRVEPKRV